MSAREEVLARIRAAHAAAPPHGPGYRTTGRAVVPQRIDLGHDADRAAGRPAARLRAGPRYSADEVAATLAAALGERGGRSVVVPSGLHRVAGADRGEGAPTRADGLGVALDVVDGSSPAARSPIAETGTLVLDAGPGQGRRVVTLIPDYHLCVVPDRPDRGRRAGAGRRGGPDPPADDDQRTRRPATSS